MSCKNASMTSIILPPMTCRLARCDSQSAFQIILVHYEELGGRESVSDEEHCGETDGAEPVSQWNMAGIIIIVTGCRLARSPFDRATIQPLELTRFVVPSVEISSHARNAAEQTKPPWRCIPTEGNPRARHRETRVGGLAVSSGQH